MDDVNGRGFARAARARGARTARCACTRAHTPRYTRARTTRFPVAADAQHGARLLPLRAHAHTHAPLYTPHTRTHAHTLTPLFTVRFILVDCSGRFGTGWDVPAGGNFA